MKIVHEQEQVISNTTLSTDSSQKYLKFSGGVQRVCLCAYSLEVHPENAIFLQGLNDLHHH